MIHLFAIVTDSQANNSSVQHYNVEVVFYLAYHSNQAKQ